jgi:hypothetical protein
VLAGIHGRLGLLGMEVGRRLDHHRVQILFDQRLMAGQDR